MDALNIAETLERKATVAKTTGTDVDAVRAVRLDIKRLLKEGLLIDVDLHNFTCLRAGVTWKELGINASDKRRDRIQKGQKVLVPIRYANRLKTLETRFRQSVTRYTFNVAAMSPWAWLPLSAWDAWKEDWELLQADLAAFKSELKADLGAIAASNEEYFKAVARRAWATYQTPDDDSVVITGTGKVMVGYESFEKDIVDSAMAKVPGPEAIDAICADYKTGLLLLPPEVVEHYGKETAVAETEWAEARKAAAEAEKAEAEVRAAKWAQNNRKYEQAAKLEAIRKAEYDRAQKTLKDTVSPIEEILLQFRDRIYTDIVSISKSLKSNGTLVGKVGNKARGLRDLYDLLAGATNDTELRAALDTLTTALDKESTGKSKYDVGAIEEAIKGVVEVTKDAASQLRRETAHSSVANFLEL